MRAVKLVLVALAVVVGVPWVASAQATLSGIVRDTSGAVLPGVTVEASSPVLIEKSRNTLTDGTGRYQIVDLRPGTYTVTFTLQGFSVVKRDDVMLTGTAVTTKTSSTHFPPHATRSHWACSSPGCMSGTALRR
jgi:hypothetical protein